MAKCLLNAQYLKGEIYGGNPENAFRDSSAGKVSSSSSSEESLSPYRVPPPREVPSPHPTSGHRHCIPPLFPAENYGRVR